MRRNIIFGETLSKKLGARDDVDIECLYSQFDPKQRSLRSEFEDLWRQIAEILRVRPSQLRLSDRFAEELFAQDGMFGVNDELDSLVEWAEFIAERRKKEIDLSKIENLGELVEFLLF